MDRRTIIAKLREHESELRASRVTGLSLFGSAARDENTPKSDVDLMAESDQSMRMTFEQFREDPKTIAAVERKL